ncbi:hypothetical protein [Alteromonas gracilis]|uniref:hypothetical protein n=1 Tax=Alteromonas gracilis TaxID=1479524 RepID=UPI00373693D9
MEIKNEIHRIFAKGKKQGHRVFIKRRIGFLRFWSSLTFAQRCYFLATAVLLLQLLFNFNNGVLEAAMFCLALAGIINEIWPKFMSLWNSLPGKALILFIYAVIANFALASASGLVNSVSGVSASALPYSHNFALILMVPSWFFVTTILGLVIGMMLTMVYLFCLLLLKPFGVQRFWHPRHYRFAMTTTVARFAWTLGVALQLSVVAEQVGLLSEFDSDLDNPVISIDTTSAEQSESGTSELTEKQVEDISRLEGEINALLTDTKQKSINYRKRQRRFLAEFIYEFEADSRSRCAHPEGTRVIELNDYEILQISPSAEMEEGYAYSVEPCISAAIGNGAY